MFAIVAEPEVIQKYRCPERGCYRLEYYTSEITIRNETKPRYSLRSLYLSSFFSPPSTRGLYLVDHLESRYSPPEYNITKSRVQLPIRGKRQVISAAPHPLKSARLDQGFASSSSFWARGQAEKC